MEIPSDDVIVTREFTFCAAHQLPYHEGKCRRLHGHNYRVAISLIGPIQEDSPANPASGMMVDFADVKRGFAAIYDEWLDHRSLNDIMENPTAERVATWLWVELAKEFQTMLFGIKLWETDDCSVEIRRHV